MPVSEKTIVDAPKKPDIIRFEARLEQESSRVFVTIPHSQASKLQGMKKLEGTINTQPFRASIVGKSHNEITVNQAMLRGSEASIGDVVHIAVLGPEPDPQQPEDLREAFIDEPAAQEKWETLETLAQHDWIRWIEDAKTAPTRNKRITRTIDQLSEGKLRPCCVNFYAYSLALINDDNEKIKS